MIEFPPNPSTIKPNAASETAAVGDTKALAQQTIQAQVVAVRALPQQAQKQLYEILLQAKVSSSGSVDQSLFQSPTTSKYTQSPITQINQAVLQSLQQGQTLQIKTQAHFPLPVATQVLASLSIGKGIEIKAVEPPPLQSQSIALKQLVPQQQSIGAVLGNALDLLANKPDTLQKLPPNLQMQLKKLIASVPSIKELTKADTVQQAFKDSGISFEAKLTKLAQDQHQSQEKSLAANKFGVGETLKVLSKRLIQGNITNTAEQSQSKDSTDNTSLDSSKKARPNQILNSESIATSKERLQPLNSDLKQQLFSLQKALQHVSKQEASKADNKPPGMPAEFTNKNNAQGLNTTTSQPDELTKFKKITLENSAAQAAKEPNSSNAKPNTPQSHHSLKHYQTQSSVASAQQGIANSSEQLLLPPLPGQVQIQAQPKITPTIKGNEMADALVSILLKQVKGAIARVTLHQMASQTQRQEGQTGNMLLSFELPFIHNNQANVIQFKIEEELEKKQSGEKQQEKRWVVQMGFDIEGLGPMLCQINLIRHSASVAFWAEWENTLSHTKAHFDYLQTALQDMGLKVEQLQGHLGIPNEEKARLTNQLVDIKT